MGDKGATGGKWPRLDSGKGMAIPGRRAGGLLAGLCVAAALAQGSAQVTVPSGWTANNSFVSGLAGPTSFAWSPDGTKLFVTEQLGTVRVFTRAAAGAADSWQETPEPFVNISSLLDFGGLYNPSNNSGYTERGLLGVELDPRFESNGYVYLFYTSNEHTPPNASAPAHNRIVRYTADSARGSVVAVPGSSVLLFEFDPLGFTGAPACCHNGGALKFGGDGKLYASHGENYNPSNAKALNSTLGKIIRINSDGSIPSDNPFYNATTGQNRAAWALGLRNPFTVAWQTQSNTALLPEPLWSTVRGTQQLKAGSAAAPPALFYINDVGNLTWEEVDIGMPGANYGWNYVEGRLVPLESFPLTYDPPAGNTFTPGPGLGFYEQPMFTYPHIDANNITNCAIIGGAFWNADAGAAVQTNAYEGQRYYISDLCAGWIRSLPVLREPAVNNADLPMAQPFATGLLAPSSMGLGPDGALYATYRGTIVLSDSLARDAAGKGVGGMVRIGKAGQ